jgi:Tfp pilus assembly protein PilO
MPLSEQDKKSLIVGIFIAVVLAAAIGYYYLMIIKPQIMKNEKEAEELGREIAKLKGEYGEMQDLMKQKDVIEQQMKIVEEAAKRLPRSPDAPGFLEELINVLRITGVTNNRVIQRAAVARHLYAEIPYEIVCSSRYHELGHFLNLIEENPRRFMRVDSFRITNDNNRPSVHPITVEISTFMFQP